MRDDIAPCPECQGDENHAPGCTHHPRHTLYWLGHNHGRRLAQHQPLENHERALRAGLALAGNTRHRAFALGELRGYRQATDRPRERTAPDPVWKVQR